MSFTSLTIYGRTDGFGAQYQALMSGLAYARYRNVKYIHTSLTSIAHNQDAKTMNEFTGFKSDDIIDDNTHIFVTIDIINYELNPSKFYTQSVLNELRTLYHSTPKPDRSSFDIAIHIRRGDVTKNNFTDRYTNDEFYVKLLKWFKPDKKICIYSEGKPDNFAKFTAFPNVSLRLNYDLKQTFHELVTVNTLIMAKSSLSYTAAILNPNTVYYY